MLGSLIGCKSSRKKRDTIGINIEPENEEVTTENKHGVEYPDSSLNRERIWETLA